MAKRFSRREFCVPFAAVVPVFLGGGFLWSRRPPKVTLCGAARLVSGSRHLLETKGKVVVIDGKPQMYQVGPQTLLNTPSQIEPAAEGGE